MAEGVVQEFSTLLGALVPDFSRFARAERLDWRNHRCHRRPDRSSNTQRPSHCH